MNTAERYIKLVLWLAAIGLAVILAERVVGQVKKQVGA